MIKYGCAVAILIGSYYIYSKKTMDKLKQENKLELFNFLPTELQIKIIQYLPRKQDIIKIFCINKYFLETFACIIFSRRLCRPKYLANYKLELNYSPFKIKYKYKYKHTKNVKTEYLKNNLPFSKKYYINMLDDFDYIYPSIKWLYINRKFNEQLPEDFCEYNNLTRICFDKKFNRPIKNLPDSITHLFLGRDFNTIINKLPNSLRVLSFGQRYNMEIPDLTNTNIQIIYLGRNYNKNLPINVPKTLKKIVILNMRYVIPNNLNYSLEFVSMSCIIKKNNWWILLPSHGVNECNKHFNKGIVFCVKHN